MTELNLWANYPLMHTLLDLYLYALSTGGQRSMCSSVGVRNTCVVAVREDVEPTDELRPLAVTLKSCNEK